MTADPLGGARRDDDCRLQLDSLSDEWSVESWATENCHETCCAQLDDFDLVIPPCDLVGSLARQEADEDLLGIAYDVCDVPDEFPVDIEVAAVELSCFPVVVQTRPQVGCNQTCPCPCIRGRNH